MGSPFEKLIDAPHRVKPAETLADLPPDALLGVSAADARLLRRALGIQTVRDLADHPAVAAARAVVAAAGGPAYDPGPPPDWAARFAAAPLAHYLGHPSRRFRLSFGPVHYRGRLDGTARVLLIGQDPAANELAAHRILVGASGQRVQGLLRKLGITRSYVMLNTFLYPVFGQYDDELAAISAEPPIAGFRGSLFDKVLAENPIEAIITIGRAAREAVTMWRPVGPQPTAVTHPGSPDDAAVTTNWNRALTDLVPRLEPDPGVVADPTPYGSGFAETDHAPIPRADLPFGVPDFIGFGSHAERDGNEVLRVTTQRL